MSRMKVLFLSRLYLPHIGGVEIHIQKLVQALGDVEVTLVTEQHDPTLPLLEKIDSVTVHRIPLPNQTTSKWHIWRWWISHLSLLFSADIIHVHDVFFWLLPFKPLIFWKKMYMTFHGYEGINNPKWNQKLWHQVADVLTEGNICIGGFHQKWFGVHPTVVSFGAVEKLPSRKVSLQQKPIKAVYVGRLASDTGILVYLEAMKILKNSHRVTLDVYGDGPQRGLAEEIAKTYKLPVTFYGFVSQKKINWTQYQVAFVSRYLAILEAFYVGVPVLAQYNVGIKKDYLTLTPFHDWIQIGQTTQELVKGFEKILLPSVEENVVAAQAWAKQQTWSLMAENYKKLWQIHT